MNSPNSPASDPAANLRLEDLHLHGYTLQERLEGIAMIQDPVRADIIRYAAQELRRLSGETRGDWQPIGTAPKDGRWLLLGSATSCFMGYWEFGEWKDQRDAVRDPTHWQPLPQKPPQTTPGEPR